MAFRDFYSGPPAGFIGDPTPQPGERLEPGVDPEAYEAFLEEARLAARGLGVVRADWPVEPRPGDGTPIPPLPL